MRRRCAGRSRHYQVLGKLSQRRSPSRNRTSESPRRTLSIIYNPLYNPVLRGKTALAMTERSMLEAAIANGGEMTGQRWFWSSPCRGRHGRDGVSADAETMVEEVVWRR